MHTTFDVGVVHEALHLIAVHGFDAGVCPIDPIPLGHQIENRGAVVVSQRRIRTFGQQSLERLKITLDNTMKK